MNAAPVHLLGERLMLDPSGVVFWPAEHLLVVSDLHLEKGSSFARRGMLLPPFDTRVTLDRLAVQLRLWRPRTVIALGDSFHDSQGAGRLAPADHGRLAALTGAAEFIWVLGNHDPAPPQGVAGRAVQEYALGPLVFRHHAAPRAQGELGGGELSGHYHPKARVPARGCSVSRPCFVTDGHRLMLPAFGAYTGGLDVRAPALGAVFPRDGRVFLLGQNRLFSFSLAALRGSALEAADQTGG